MTCKELVEFLDRYITKELAADLTERFEAHVSGCADCTRYLQSYRSTINLARQGAQDPDGSPPEAVPEGLIRAILATKRGIRP